LQRFLIVLALVAVAFGFGAGSVKAQAFSYTTGFQVQNLENAEASVNIAYYNQDGTLNVEVDDTIAANDSNTYFPIAPAAGFNGSVVIASSTKVATVVNILGDNGAAAASYVGSSAGATSVLLPLLMQDNSGFNTWFNVQNTGSAAATVNVAYSDGTTAGPVTIQPGASQTFNQATETHTEAVFSGVITSDQPVAAAVIEESSAVMFAYSGFTGGVTNPVMPLVNANNAQYITGIQIQNGGASPTDVTVSYTPSFAGTACTETRTIPANSSETFALYAFNNGDSSTCAGGATFVGSAEVTANSASMPLVAIVNQLKPGVNGEAYGSFDSAAATDTVVMPLIMDRNSGYYTGFNVANVGAGSVTVNCTFTGSAYTVSDTLAAGEAMTALQNGLIADGYVGSGTCTATGGTIVGVVNELGPSGTADQLLVYEGINP
jgi:hypothetical protein